MSSSGSGGPFHRYHGGTEHALMPKMASERREFVQMQILHHDAVCKGQLQRLERKLSAEHARGVLGRLIYADLQANSLRDLRPGSVGHEGHTGARKHVKLKRECYNREKMG